MASSFSANRSPSPASSAVRRPTRSTRPPSFSSSSNGHASEKNNGHASPTSNGTVSASPTGSEIGTRANGHAKKRSEDRRKKSKAKGKEKVDETIDWEIPRKVFHSSIGFLTVGLYLNHTPPRLIILALVGALAVIVPCDVLRFRYPAFARTWEACVGGLMRESEKHKTNGTIWFILGVIFVLAVYPLDLAVVSILILSWADTAASTIGRAFGRHTPRLPARVPILRLPFAPRKSLAGFLAATVTGAGIAIGFWGFVAPLGVGNVGIASVRDLCWTWSGVGRSLTGGNGLLDFTSFFGQDAVLKVQGLTAVLLDNVAPVQAVIDSIKAAVGLRSLASGGWTALSVVSVAAGLVTGVAEALDLGDLDDNLTLPIISGGCIWAVFRILSWAST